MKEIASKSSGTVQPFVFDNMPIRGMLLRIDNLYEHIPSLEQMPKFIEKSLVEMLAASAILTFDLKNKSNVTLQIQSTSDVPLMVAGCDKTGNLKALARIKENANLDDFSYKSLAKDNTIFAVSVEQGEKDNRNVYQSLVGLNQTSVSSSVEQYFNDSVQLNTYFKVNVGKIGDKLCCGCIFLQALPEKEHNMDDWRRMAIILSTMTDQEFLPGKITEKELLIRLFAEDKVRVYENHDLHFAAPKTRERMATALKSLGEDQCKDLLKEGPILMTCEFTGTEEKFTETDVIGIFDTEE
jgi:molecular chaperone Hsp33